MRGRQILGMSMRCISQILAWSKVSGRILGTSHVTYGFNHLFCTLNFSHRFRRFNVRTLTRPNDTSIVGHGELMMTIGRRGRGVEILLTASWQRVRRQSGETSAHAWIGVSERPVRSTRRPHIRARNVIRVR